jgi:NhaP-type Na+/H+ or K+/H+ antiporter
MTGMPPLLLGFFIGAAGGLVLGTMMGYRWGLAHVKVNDWQNTKKAVPALRKAAFALIRRALTPTGFLVGVIAVFSCYVYVQAKIGG